MKLINLAYHTLKDDRRRREYDAARMPRIRFREDEDVKRARACIDGYFSALIDNDYERAFSFVSMYDRRFVTSESFREWRQSVRRLFSIRGFRTAGGGQMENMPLEDGTVFLARRFEVAVTERNRAERATNRYSVAKYAVLENGVWRVFLGYADLSGITKTFEHLVESSERGEMERHWEEYRREMCGELGIYSLEGFLRRAEVEIYRYERYRRELTVACFAVSPPRTDVLEACARALTRTVRTSDIAAYADDGLFAVLYAELKKKHAGMISSRLAEELKSSAAAETGAEIKIAVSFEPFTGGNLRDYIARTGSAAVAGLRG